MTSGAAILAVRQIAFARNLRIIRCLSQDRFTELQHPSDLHA